MRWFAVAAVLFLCSIQVSADDTIIGRAAIVDGDTIHVGPVTVRLHGIDAPESDQTCKTSAGGTWTCGAEATRALQSIIGGQT